MGSAANGKITDTRGEIYLASPPVKANKATRMVMVTRIL